MKSNYKRLGDYVESCDEKNTGNIVKKLQGISNQKYFQKAKTNTIGVDLEKYRIVRTGQFAFNRATTRNGDKISIAYRFGNDCIVSPSYRIFKSKDENILNSEYLMMWFKRPEFDRFARFKSHGSAHEFFDWGEMCETELPIPPVEKQQEIVREYNIIQNRIALNNQLITKLEETAQAIYKQWFVDFEFPYVTSSGVEMPYKSNGGKMVWCEEFGKEIPEGCKYGSINDLVDSQYGYTASADFEFDGPKFLRITDIANDYIDWETVPNCDISEKEKQKYLLEKGDVIVARTGATVGAAKQINKLSPKAVFASYLVRLKPKENKSIQFLGSTIVNPKYREYILSAAGGSAQPQANAVIMTQYEIVIPNDNIMILFDKIVTPIIDTQELIQIQNSKLIELKELLLAKMTRLD
jgi:type I restriction enzyme S subunit